MTWESIYVDRHILVLFLIAIIALVVAADLATRGPERRAAKRLRKLFRADLSPGIPVIRAMPRRKRK